MNDTQEPQSTKSTSKLPPSTLMDVKDLAQRLNCSDRTVWRLVDSGQMPVPLNLGRLKRWDPAAIDRWIVDGCPRVRRSMTRR